MMDTLITLAIGTTIGIIILRHRYWHDFTGQPRRNPLMKSLIHNGKAPR